MVGDIITIKGKAQPEHSHYKNWWWNVATREYHLKKNNILHFTTFEIARDQYKQNQNCASVYDGLALWQLKIEKRKQRNMGSQFQVQKLTVRVIKWKKLQ